MRRRARACRSKVRRLGRWVRRGSPCVHPDTTRATFPTTSRPPTEATVRSRRTRGPGGRAQCRVQRQDRAPAHEARALRVATCRLNGRWGRSIDGREVACGVKALAEMDLTRRVINDERHAVLDVAAGCWLRLAVRHREVDQETSSPSILLPASDRRTARPCEPRRRDHEALIELHHRGWQACGTTPRRALVSWRTVRAIRECPSVRARNPPVVRMLLLGVPRLPGGLALRRNHAGKSSRACGSGPSRASPLADIAGLSSDARSRESELPCVRMR